jgi:hypothetical protein
VGASGGAVEVDGADAAIAAASLTPGAAEETAIETGAAEDAAMGADAVESDVEAEARVGDAEFEEEERGPRSSVADADRLKSANNIIKAHTMASFTLPPGGERKMLARTIEMWISEGRFLPQTVRMKIRPATE